MRLDRAEDTQAVLQRPPDPPRLLLPLLLGRPLPPGRHPLGHDQLRLTPALLPGGFGYTPPSRWKRLRAWLARALARTLGDAAPSR